MKKYVFACLGVTVCIMLGTAMAQAVLPSSSSSSPTLAKGAPLMLPNPETRAKATLVLAVEPQAKKAKAYGDLGSLLGGLITRDLALALKGRGKQSFISPQQADEAFRLGGKLKEREQFLDKINHKANFALTDMKGLNTALCHTYKELCASSQLAYTGADRILVLRSDLDFTRPYKPPSRAKRWISWLQGSLNEEAMGYVDVDIQRFDRGANGIYQIVHQWQGEFRLPTDRMVGAVLSVYDEPSANTWVSRLGHEVFQAYWKDRSGDYGIVRNVNPLNKIPIPPKEAWEFNEAKLDSYR
jgi:hypothetical protein